MYLSELNPDCLQHVHYVCEGKDKFVLNGIISCILILSARFAWPS